MNTKQERSSICRLLVVEDDPITRAVLERALQSEGIEVTSVGTAEESLQFLTTEVFDLVLLDLHLDGMSGWEVATRIRSGELGLVHTQVPIVALTGADTPEELHRCEVVGMNGRIGKPFDTEDLKRIVQGWCGKRTERDSTISSDETSLSKGAGKESYPKTLWKKFEGDGEFIKSLILTFQSDVSEKLFQMAEAYCTQNWKTLERVAHSLKGAAGVLELTALQEEVAHLETLAKKEDYLHSNICIEKLKNLFQKINFEDILRQIEDLSTKGG